MLANRRGKMMKGAKGLVWLCVFTFVMACAADRAAKQEPVDTPPTTPEAVEQKSVTDIRVSEGPEAITVAITGNRLLTYTSVKQPMPLGLVLYFPETSMEASETDIVLEGGAVAGVQAVELVENGPSKITIALNEDVPYQINRDGDMLNVAFSKPTAEDAAEETAVPEEPLAEEAAVQPEQAGAAAVATGAAVVAAAPEPEPAGVNMLQEIRVQEETNGLVISMVTDNPVAGAKTFTLKDPARIVIDLFDVKSPHAGQQVIPVNTRWAKDIRHLGHDDKVRVVVDTDEPLLASYFSESDGNVFTVRISEPETPAAAEVTAPVEDVAAPPTVAVTAPAVVAAAETAEPESPAVVMEAPKGPALVNRIDFLARDKGESSLIIGTTHPVRYDAGKINDKTIQIDLYDTKILSYRQRPLITTRFESAVDRISPIQTREMGNNSKIVIELRDIVPYEVAQEDNQIRIDFAATPIPPKPLASANLPDWKRVLEEAALTPAVATSAPAEAPAGEPATAVEEVKLTEETADVDIAPMAETKPAEGAGADVTSAKTLYGTPTKRYTGEKIALDFYRTDVKNVLRILRDVSGKNFAIDKDVQGSVTLTLVKPVPWDQVLDLVLKMNSLGMIREGEIVRIVTLKTLAEEEKRLADALKAEATLKEQQKALEPLVTEYIPINYANATSDIKPRLDEIKTPNRGNIGVDSRNNQIIMTDTAAKIAQAKDIVRRIDKVTPQVIIEARIVEVSDTFARRIGTQWDAAGQRPAGQNTSDWSVAMNHLPSAQSGSIGYNFQRIVGTPFSLNAELQAIETRGEGKIISTPKIVTLDNKEAIIKQGLEYPYLERDSSGLATVKFKQVDLELKVTPHVTPDNRITMKMSVIKNDVDDFVQGVPSLATNEANTELLVNDGDTIVIGGIIKTNTSESSTGWPLLSQIPLLGWAFKNNETSIEKNELLIFITPRIVHLEQSV